MARYYIKARRKNTDEKWSNWTHTNHYPTALKHVEHVRALGYDAKLTLTEAVKQLWEILEGHENKIELTEKILDAGFCLRKTPATTQTETERTE